MNASMPMRKGLNGMLELPTLGGATSESPTPCGLRSNFKKIYILL